MSSGRWRLCGVQFEGVMAQEPEEGGAKEGMEKEAEEGEGEEEGEEEHARAGQKERGR